MRDRTATIGELALWSLALSVLVLTILACATRGFVRQARGSTAPGYYEALPVSVEEGEIAPRFYLRLDAGSPDHAQPLRRAACPCSRDRQCGCPDHACVTPCRLEESHGR